MLKLKDWKFVHDGNSDVIFDNGRMIISQDQEVIMNVNVTQQRILRSAKTIELYLNYFIENFDDGLLFDFYRDGVNLKRTHQFVIHHPLAIIGLMENKKYKLFTKIKEMVDYNFTEDEVIEGVTYSFDKKLQKNIMIASIASMLMLPFTLLNSEWAKNADGKNGNFNNHVFDLYTKSIFSYVDITYGSDMFAIITNKVKELFEDITGKVSVGEPFLPTAFSLDGIALRVSEQYSTPTTQVIKFDTKFIVIGTRIVSTILYNLTFDKNINKLLNRTIDSRVKYEVLMKE